jgi:2-phospho-L-lactate guanylyltransferase
MLEDVLEACRRAIMVRGILVVTPDRAAAPPGVDILKDPGDGHCRAIELALGRTGGEGALIVMADCPLVQPEALDRLVEAARPVALGPAQDGGTNALAMRGAVVVPLAFGLPDGARVMADRARAAGLEPAIIEDPTIALDVDTPEDLRRVLELGDGTRTHAFLSRTIAALTELDR